MANANNDVDIVAEILAEMGDSQTSSTLSNQVPTKADSLGFRRRHHPFLTTSSQTPKNRGLQSAEEQNRFP